MRHYKIDRSRGMVRARLEDITATNECEGGRRLDKRITGQPAGARKRISRRAMLNWSGQGLLAAAGLALIGSVVLSSDAEVAYGKKSKPTSTPTPTRTPKKSKRTPTPTVTPVATQTPTPTPGGQQAFNPANYIGQGDRYNC